MRKTIQAALSATLLVGFSQHANTQSRKEVYELQERCGKSASEMFDKDFPKEDRKGLESFENHYNVRLNKCFLLEENTMITRDQGKTFNTKLLTLIDVHGNKVSASLVPSTATCRTKNAVPSKSSER